MRATEATDLLPAIAQGDSDALGALYDRHAAILLGLATRILGNRAEAEEVVQEVFIQVWQRAGTYDSSRGRPLAWLTVLTRSRALDRLRSKGARSRADDKSVDPNPEPMATPAEHASQSERQRVVRDALAQLAEGPREALQLAYFKGLSHTEIALQLGRPLGTVKTHVRTGLMRLAEILGSSAEDLTG